MKEAKIKKFRNLCKSNAVLLSIGSLVSTTAFISTQINQKSFVHNNTFSVKTNISFNTRIDLSSTQISGLNNSAIKNKTNDIWVNEIGISDGSYFTYKNSALGNKNIIWNILLLATNLPSIISEENVEFKIFRSSTGIDGSVFLAINLHILGNSSSESQNENGINKNTIIELTGFKSHAITDVGYDNYTVNHSTKVDYQSLASNLPSNFNELSFEAKVFALSNFIKNNWIYFLKFNEPGFVATKLNNHSTLLDDFLGDINISGAFSLIDNNLTLSFTYIQSRNAVEKNPGLAKNINISNVNLPPKKKTYLGLGLDFSQIIGMSLCFSGGVLFLISIIAFLAKKSSSKNNYYI